MDVGRCSVMSSAARFYPLRLCPGEDLVLSLRRLVAGAGIQAGYIAGAVGSLSRVELRYAGRPEGTVRDGCFEIVSLIGTLDPAGEHLHMTVSDPEGRVEGGLRGGIPQRGGAEADPVRGLGGYGDEPDRQGAELRDRLGDREGPAAEDAGAIPQRLPGGLGADVTLSPSLAFWVRLNWGRGCADFPCD